MNSDPNHNVHESIIDQMMNKKPVSFTNLDIDKYIKKENIKEVISHNIFEPNSRKFNTNGLFSEEIFGPITDTARFINMGYINLKTDIYRPIIYEIITTIKRSYKDILAGKAIVKFDKEINDFIQTTESDPESGTGYSFFIENFEKKKLDSTIIKSLSRKNQMDLLIKYKGDWYTDKLLVLPAGIRDIKEEGGRISQESINKIYLTILSLSNSFTDKSNDPLYDSIRFNIQSKVYDVYNYIQNFTGNGGKHTFLQGKYGARSIALGTRNVISPAVFTGKTPDDPTAIKFDETGISMYLAIKAFQPIIIGYLNNYFFNDFFSEGTSTAYVIDSKDNSKRYIEISLKEKERYTKSEKIESLLSKFKYLNFRNSPISVKGKDNKDYYLAFVYEDNNIIYIQKTIDQLLRELKIDDIKKLDKSKLKYLTWAELLYIIIYIVTIKRHVIITRYPAVEDGSIYPSKVHLMTTVKSKNIKIRYLNLDFKLPHYPIIGESYYETTLLHISRLPGLKADFDGDTISVNSILASDSNKEIKDYEDSLLAYVSDNMQLKIRQDASSVDSVLYNLTS